jgi:hypothetical protein
MLRRRMLEGNGSTMIQSEFAMRAYMQAAKVELELTRSRTAHSWRRLFRVG